jgi:hypothetical protein
MMTKGCLLSLAKMVGQPARWNSEAFDEKFTDMINYLLLVEAIMVEQMGPTTKSTDDRTTAIMPPNGGKENEITRNTDE